MTRLSISPGDYGAIAVGGTLGASLRWLVTNPSAPLTDGGWFSYSPNTAFTVGTNMTGFNPVQQNQTLAPATGIPFSTLTVNLVGCLLLGALTLLLVRSTGIRRRLLVGATTGLCGSLTTFSTFAVELATLLRGRPASLAPELRGLNINFERHLPSAALYLLLSLVGGGLAFWIGRSLAKRIVRSPGDVTIGDASGDAS